MSYHRNLAHRNVALGDTATVVNAAKVAGSVATDPYFNEALCRVQQLSAIENGKPVPVCAVTPSGRVGGVGLRAAMPPLRAYVYASRQPGKWPLFAAIAGAVGLPMLIGYAIGKAGR